MPNRFLIAFLLLALTACDDSTSTGPAPQFDVGTDVTSDVAPVDVPPMEDAEVPSDTADGAEDSTAQPDAGSEPDSDVADVGPEDAITEDAGDATMEDAGEEVTAPIWDGNLTVMTFNLRTWSAFEDDEDHWDTRKDIVVDAVRATDPDIIGTQEAWINQVQHIANALPQYAWTGVSRFGGNFDEYCAVLWREDRFALEDDGTFWLSPTPDVPHSVFSDAQLVTRIVTWVKLRPLGGGEPFFVFNTHFDTRSVDDIQVRAAALLAEKAQTIAGDAVTFAIGDFNTAPQSDPWKILTGELEYNGVTGHFLDPWITLALPEEGTFHRFSGVATGTRIDWVLYTAGATPTAAWVDHYNEDGRYPSDHFPVTATFVIETSAW